MSLIPDEELKRQGGMNLAPMVDFLFLVLAVFAVLAVTRAALYDSEVQLVQASQKEEEEAAPSYYDFYTVNLSITESGQYKWVTEINEYLMEGVAAIKEELLKQQALGLLPKDKEHTKVLLHIDKRAKWEPIAQAIFAVRGAGFAVHPVYEEMEDSLNP